MQYVPLNSVSKMKEADLEQVKQKGGISNKKKNISDKRIDI